MDPFAFSQAFEGKRVFVSGHTGFKGAWLCETLLRFGAEVHGYALPAESGSLFTLLTLHSRIHHTEADIRDLGSLKAAVAKARPDYIVHLAAQPLVRQAYHSPVETFSTNVQGTVHLLEAARGLESPCVVLAVTSDKCYRNPGGLHGHLETDPLGGSEPYAASKAAAEMAIEAYRSSYFQPGKSPVRVASVRAGNVIGGGDWAQDRLVPDAVRALSAARPILVRNPDAVRPWQHVLDCISGYLTLGVALSKEPSLASAYNFGPARTCERTVRDLVEEILKHWNGRWAPAQDAGGPKETPVLSLSSEKASRALGWKPVWDFEEAVARTIAWYREHASDVSAACIGELTRRQIHAFFTTPIPAHPPVAASP